MLISIDTLRADRLGIYGHTRPTSPSLDAFARRGVVFEDASATSPWTLPSHASMLTGYYPKQAGVVQMTDRLPTTVRSLAERLGQAGFRTVGVVNTLFLHEDWALNRGFDRLIVFPSDQSAEGAAERVTNRALEALGAQGKDGSSEARPPLFLFVHYYDVHAEYVSRPTIEELFLPDPPMREVTSSVRDLGFVNSGRRAISPAEVDALSRRYDAGIRQLDGQLARLLAVIEETAKSRRTLAVVTSDHGEAFYEHGTLSHGVHQFQEEIRIPLVAFGSSVPESTKVPTPVSLVDIVPTMLAAAGLPRPATLPGRDLAQCWRPNGCPERPLWAQAAPQGGAEADSRQMVRDAQWKLVRDTAAGETRLFDLADDPAEQRDLAERHPNVVERLAKTLDAFESAPGPSGGSEPVAIDDAMRERLRALGYAE